MAVAVVVIERHRGGRRSRGCMPGPIGRVDKEKVLPALVVVIEKRHAAAHGFGQQFFAVSAVMMGESDAGFPGDVGEFGGRHFGARARRRDRGGKLGDAGGGGGGLRWRKKTAAPNKRPTMTRMASDQRTALPMIASSTLASSSGSPGRGAGLSIIQLYHCGSSTFPVEWKPCLEVCRRLSIPKGLNLTAQGCDEGATLGEREFTTL